MPKLLQNKPSKIRFFTTAVHNESMKRNRILERKISFEKHFHLWKDTQTPFSYINRVVGKHQGQLLKELKQLDKNKSTKACVIDWGCGEGTSIKNIAQNFPNLKVMGFSIQSYPKWRQNQPHNLEYLHTTTNALERYLSINKINVGVIYSYNAIAYLPPHEFVKHVINLRKVLIPHGKILFPTYPILKNSPNAKQLTASGYKLGYENYFLVSLEKV